MGAPTPAAARGSRAPGAGGRCAARALHSLPPPGGSPQESSKQARSGGGSATPRYGGPSSRARGSKARSAGVLAQQPFPGPPRPGRRGALLPRRGRPGPRVGVGTGTGGESTWPPGNVGAPQPAPAHLCAGKWTREGRVAVGARENRGPSRRGPGRSRDARRAAFQPCRPLRVAAGSSFWVAGCGPLLPALPPGR